MTDAGVTWSVSTWQQPVPAARSAVRSALVAEAAEALHRRRYLVGELLYVDEVDPISRADVVIDNRDLDHPVLVRRPETWAVSGPVGARRQAAGSRRRGRVVGRRRVGG